MHVPMGTVGASGQVALRVARAVRPALAWRLRNARHWWRGWWKVQAARLLGIPTAYGTLRLVHQRADGTTTDYGIISYRVITNEFVAHIVTALGGTTTRFIDYDYHDCGTGTTAEAAADTALVTAYGGSRATGTPSAPAANQYRSTGTVSFSGTFAITEHGLFSAASGTDELMDRSVFSAVNVVSGDSIQFQYTATFTAGS